MDVLPLLSMCASVIKRVCHCGQCDNPESSELLICSFYHLLCLISLRMYSHIACHICVKSWDCYSILDFYSTEVLYNLYLLSLQV